MVSNRLIGLAYRGGAEVDLTDDTDLNKKFDFSTNSGRSDARQFIDNLVSKEAFKYYNVGLNPPPELRMMMDKIFAEDLANFKNQTQNRKAFDEAISYFSALQNKEKDESKKLYKEALKRQQSRVYPKLPPSRPSKKEMESAEFLKLYDKALKRQQSRVYPKLPPSRPLIISESPKKSDLSKMRKIVERLDDLRNDPYANPDEVYKLSNDVRVLRKILFPKEDARIEKLGDDFIQRIETENLPSSLTQKLNKENVIAIASINSEISKKLFSEEEPKSKKATELKKLKLYLEKIKSRLAPEDTATPYYLRDRIFGNDKAKHRKKKLTKKDLSDLNIFLYTLGAGN